MVLPRKAIISITSAQATLFNGKETTGLFISEALHPYDVLTAAGFEVDLVSETGTYIADWLSQQPDFLNGKDLQTWNDQASDFRKKLDNMRASGKDEHIDLTPPIELRSSTTCPRPLMWMVPNTESSMPPPDMQL